MIKKAGRHFLLCIPIIFLLNICAFFASWNGQVPLVAKADNNGQLSIFLFYYTYGGTYNRYKDKDDNKFVYDSINKRYSIEIVLFEGDFFAPNITGQGFAYYSDKLSVETKQKLLLQNISPHTGGNQFHVNKSGTYLINISNNIEDYSKEEDFYKIWDDVNSSIVYISDSISSFDPLGNENICLIGNFDKSGWNGSRYSDRSFSFNQQNNKYEFYYNLYEGDEFCFETERHGRLYYYTSEYSNKMFDDNHIGKDNDGDFICKKDGLYKFSIDYKVEYFFDGGFLWSETIGSTITFLGKTKSPTVRGSETIILTGNINGNDILNNSSAYMFNYNPSSKQYKIRLYLKEGDYFRPYLKNKGTTAEVFNANDFLKNMCDGANVEFVKMWNINSFYINKPGYYEIAIGANVENLRNANHCWLPHGESYIRYLGNDVQTAFVSSSSLLSNTSKIFADGDNDVKQYGLDGVDINAVSYIQLNTQNAKGNFFKVDYDPYYTNNIEIANTVGEEIKTCTLSPKNLHCFDIDNGKADAFLGCACSFLSLLSDCLDGIECGNTVVADYSKINATNADKILMQYNNLDEAPKKYVDDALISTMDNKGEETQIHFSDIIPFLNNILKKNNQETKSRIFLYIILSIVGSAVIGFISLSFKRKRGNKRSDNIKNRNEQESFKIDI